MPDSFDCPRHSGFSLIRQLFMSASDLEEPGEPGEFPNNEISTSATASLLSSIGRGSSEFSAAPPHLSFTALLARAESFIGAGEDRQAAHSLLFCLERFRDSREYSNLARCLALLANILYKHGNFQKSLEFRAAEKLIYEAELLELSKEIPQDEPAEPLWRRSVLSSVAPRSLVDEERRAENFERLARLFHKEKSLKIAKTYARQAIEIRDRLKIRYGDPEKDDGEEIAVRQIIEAGKEEYSNTLNSFNGGEGPLEEKNDKFANVSWRFSEFGRSIEVAERLSQNPPEAKIARRKKAEKEEKKEENKEENRKSENEIPSQNTAKPWRALAIFSFASCFLLSLVLFYYLSGPALLHKTF